MRLTFPLDDTIFTYTQPGEPIRQPWVTQLTVYADAACTELADIVTLANAPITGSVIYVGNDGLIPTFRGPDNGARVLWVKAPEKPAFIVEARLSSQLAVLTSEVEDYADDLAERAVDTILIEEIGAAPGTIQPGLQVIYNDTGYAWDLIALRYSARVAGAQATQVSLDFDGAEEVSTRSTLLATERTVLAGDVTTLIVQPGSSMRLRLGPSSGSYTSAPSGVFAQVVVRHVPPTVMDAG